MEIFAIVVFLMLSAFFSGLEIAFISANKLGVELKKSSGSRKGRIIGAFYDRPDSFLGGLLVGNNIALVAFTYFMTRFLAARLDNYVDSGILLLILITLIITAMVLIFGEFLPKTLFRLYANQILFATAYVISFFQMLLKPPTWFVTSLSGFMLKNIFRQKFDYDDNSFTRHDLERFVSSEEVAKGNHLDTDLFRNALNLKEVKVRDCMVPRTEIQYIDVTSNIHEVIKSFRATSHSRLLVIDGDIDKVIGYVHHQSLFSKQSSIRKMMMEIPIVPEVLNVKDLLVMFTKSRINIACVVDEYGGTSGLITLEDVLEEIFGEIEDEHDLEELVEKQVGEGEYLFSGRLEIDYLNEKYDDIKFPEGEYVTLSGYLTNITGNIPEQGTMVEQNGYRFTMELVSDKKIETVRVNILDNAS
ncbi:MAG: HlyC/CorC family transporter [Saprospirales bacterium]|nr:MAG: HlyC/CorC family transporter [Saprospirales bacterium]